MGSHGSVFTRFAKGASRAAGHKWSFIAAVVVILAWAAAGPFFHYSDTWQLTINTGTTIVTFLMVFIIQNTQNRDTEALHIKIDELMRANPKAHNALMALDEVPEEELNRMLHGYEKMAHQTQQALKKRK
ncbi:MAG TPA: low affinity iron permease family protein [Candidatus Thermoplasmatota archaeon]|nr:low affinity iron permease family protein [Candidatus Thermoplasmatota archaeon]